MLREIRIALPEHADDIYRRHQLVWRAVHGHVGSGRDFLFTAIGSHQALVRSEALPRGAASELREGLLMAALVTSVRTNGTGDGDMLPEAMLGEWLTQLVSENGFRLNRYTVLTEGTVRGRKIDPSTGRTLAIRLPVREIQLDVTIQHTAKANLAWKNGLGRAKRFGYGMLRHAE